MVKAKVKRRQQLAIIETEIGQRAVIPLDALCDFARKLNLILVAEDGKEIECK
ncbi:MAG: hypothetical protein QXO93_02060 [Acidilobaceae archaeon]